MTCILGQEYIQKGRAEGIEQGIEQGISQGIEQGIALGADQNLIENIHQIMNKLNYTLSQAMELLGVKEEQRAHIIELYKKSEQE